MPRRRAPARLAARPMRSRPGKVRLKTPPDQLLASGILLPDLPPSQPLDLAAAFGNARPVEVEIGPGKGGFLLRRAGERAEINLLGIEWVRAYAMYAADRALRAGLCKVRLLCADAGAVFTNSMPPRGLSRVHIYFPDPWPKRRHRGRRLVTVAFLAAVREALAPGGWLGIVTDHDDYFRQIRRALATTDGLRQVAFEPVGDDGLSLVESNFEKKYSGAGRRLHAAAGIRLR